ncbi:potassium channel SKOR [Quillaja saponaria]|uniref:Potassium channel SKOR n=1 Tax=Quillaja saponaria TaxID=32244 RepID=A0AAD7LN71_QUISA|nr:potassium channel SKOR [Quillaja saponaria]
MAVRKKKEFEVEVAAAEEEEKKMRKTTSSSSSSSDNDEEYEVDNLRDRIKSSRGSRFNLIENELGLESTGRKFSRQTVIDGIKDLSKELFINPDNRWYRAWTKFILIWAIYSSFFTPMEFGFFRGLPENLFILDIVGQIAFLVDIVFQVLPCLQRHSDLSYGVQAHPYSSPVFEIWLYH